MKEIMRKRSMLETRPEMRKCAAIGRREGAQQVLIAIHRCLTVNVLTNKQNSYYRASGKP